MKKIYIWFVCDSSHRIFKWPLRRSRILLGPGVQVLAVEGEPMQYRKIQFFEG